jgi:hypothetical protein
MCVKKRTAGKKSMLKVSLRATSSCAVGKKEGEK